MLVFTFIVGHVLRRRKMTVMHEAGAALLIGVLVGLIVRASGEERGFKSWINFNNRFFFYFLLPPIIFESGWSLRLKPFFGNFGAICTFAFAGTLISTLGVGILIYLFGLFKWTYSMPFLVCLAFGALISATDPVTVLSIFHELGTDADLYAYVFGESVLNDAHSLQDETKVWLQNFEVQAHTPVVVFGYNRVKQAVLAHYRNIEVPDEVWHEILGYTQKANQSVDDFVMQFTRLWDKWARALGNEICPAMPKNRLSQI
ncbi:hypothetical protein L7F22_030055 [Adiantum nelumboides]|nr:hypothetical protein [Adiantum nelumboides]